MDNLKILSKTIFNNTAILSVIIPALAYPFLTSTLGLWMATILLAVYCMIIDFWLRMLGNFSYVVLLFGLVNLAIAFLVPPDYLIDALSIQAQIYSFQMIIVLLILLILKRPLPMLLAEAFASPLKELRKTHGKEYIGIFARISVAWTVAYLAKACLFLGHSHFSESFYSSVRIATGWPFVVALIYFSISYSRKQFELRGFEN